MNGPSWVEGRWGADWSHGRGARQDAPRPLSCTARRVARTAIWVSLALASVLAACGGKDEHKDHRNQGSNSK
jgi:hypothetical protein